MTGINSHKLVAHNHSSALGLKTLPLVHHQSFFLSLWYDRATHTRNHLLSASIPRHSTLRPSQTHRLSGASTVKLALVALGHQ